MRVRRTAMVFSGIGTARVPSAMAPEAAEADLGDGRFARLAGWAVPAGVARTAAEDDGPRIPITSGGSGARVPITSAPSDEDTLAPAEEKICTVHPAMFRAHPWRYMLLVLLVVAGLVGLLYGALNSDRYFWLIWVGGVATLAGAIWWVVWWFTSTVCKKLVITNKRSMRSEGFIRRSSTEVLHDHVRSVDIKQGFVDRVLNVGYIGIDSAGQDGIEIEINDIPRPHDVKAIIDRYRRM